MSKRRFVVVFTVLAIASPLALAEPAKPAAAKPAMQAPKPASEISQYKVFNATWRCAGQFLGNEVFGPGHPTKATFKASPELDGFWYTGRYQESKTKENPMPYEADFVWGYDSGAKRFTAESHDNMGGMVSQTSAGWESEDGVHGRGSDGRTEDDVSRHVHEEGRRRADAPG
jgi:hypothetical protein